MSAEEEELPPSPASASAERVAGESAYVAGGSIGAHLKDSHVFTVEVLSNRTIKAVIVTYYVIFAALLAYDLSEYRDTHSRIALSIVPPPPEVAALNGNESDPLLCVPNYETLTCDQNPSSAPIKSSEASLLSNTILVSDGLNVSDWVGDRAKPGTPPFNAHAKSSGAFLMNSSVLDYGANPDLHDVWSDLSGSIWLGSSRTTAWLEGGAVSRSARSVGLSFDFTRSDGSAWPDDTLSDGMGLPLTIHSYACLTGQDCTSIGSYRGQFLPTPNAWVPEREPYRMNALLSLNEARNVLSARIDVPNTMMVDGVLDGSGWRFALGADPGGAVSACAAGAESCVVGVGLTAEGTKASFRVNAIIGCVALVVYLPYLIWWLVTVCKRLGTDVKTWPVEVFWLIFLGVGHLMFNGILITCISMYHLTSTFVFNERLWAAASIISQLGKVLQFFSLGCFTDSPRRFVVSQLKFYGWKALFCVVLWTSMFVTIMYHYPLASGRDEPGTDLIIGGLGFPTAPETWPRNEKIVLSAFQLLWLVCVFGAMAYYFIVSRRTMRVLAELPYIMTRPVQLAFRFFRWSTLIWIVSELVTLIVNLVYSANEGGNYGALAAGGLDAMVVTLNQMETFEAHTSSLAKILFGTVFTTVFLGFFLPLDPSDAANAVIKSHYVTEEEARKTEEAECEGKAERRPRGQSKHLLVLDRARLLCTCSRETYLPFDAEERRLDAGAAKKEEIMSGSTNFTGDDQAKATPAAGGGEDKGAALKDTLRKYLDDAAAALEEGKRRKEEGLVDGRLGRVDSWMPTEYYAKKGIDPHPWLECRLAGEPMCWGEPSPPGSSYAMDCRVVKLIQEPSYADMHDSRAVVFRHVPSNDLIVAFRGTATSKQVKTDLMTQKVEVSLDRFLTVSSHRERARRMVEGVLPEDLERKMEEGTAGKVRILDLLHRDDDEHLPEFLKGRSMSGDKFRGTGQLHFGFFSSYSRLRKQVHATIYEELVRSPSRLLVTGHSLGGAQATACAYDMSRWIIPSVKKDLLYNRGKAAADKVTLCCYTFGAPRLGGPRFQAAFDKAVPETHRVINDGDVVTTTPPHWLGFNHVGTEHVLDYTGSLMTDPSMIERKFGNKTRTHADSHRMLNYTKAIKRAYRPVMPIEDLLGMIRNAYGYDGKQKEKKNHWARDT